MSNPCHITGCAHPGFPVLHVSQSLLRRLSIESVMPSNHLILCRPLLFLPSIFPNIRVFSNESALHIRWPKYWSFRIRPSNECSGLISLSARDTQESSSTSQFKSINSLVLTFFTVQLTHPYITTGKTIAFSLRTFVSKVISLLFNMLSRFVLAFLSRTMHPLISWLQSPFTVIFGAHKNKTCYCFNFFPFYFP